jgi:CheY-like chemotaxis protein
MAQTVLIADDSIASQRLLEMVLTREGYDVVTVSSGPEVLEQVKEKQPDLALIDAIMPEVDGYQICQTLKRDPTFKNLPVIMLAGTHEDFDREKGAEIVGTEAILDKPSKSQIIVSKVKEFLALQEQLQRERKEAELPPMSAQATMEAEQPPEAEGYAEVIQEPTFVEEEYEFDEDSEEVDLAVESEILDEEAEWEEADETLAMEEYEEEPFEEPAARADETSSSIPTFVEERQVEGIAPPVRVGSSQFTDEHLDEIAEEIAKRVAGKLVPVFMQSLTKYFLEIPSVKHVVENASKNLVKEILPEVHNKLK